MPNKLNLTSHLATYVSNYFNIIFVRYVVLWYFVVLNRIWRVFDNLLWIRLVMMTSPFARFSGVFFFL